MPSFKNRVNAKELYHYLARFGMYKPSRASMDGLRWIRDKNIWIKIRYLYQKYQARWAGPRIRIFIFPMNGPGLFRNNKRDKKSGVSFPDKMFLFLSPMEDLKELEALFIHEYHHICRIHAQKKMLKNYTLMDSIILEGTAEFTVEQLCGKKYRANWCSFYSEEQLDEYWNSLIKKNLKRNKKDRLHDAILFGYHRFPQLIGYAVGYQLVSVYYKNQPYSVKSSLVLPAKKIINNSLKKSK